MNHEKYTYRVMWSEEDHEHVGQCAEFPSLSWLAKTPGEALSGIVELVAGMLKDLAANKEPIPDPLSFRRFDEFKPRRCRECGEGTVRPLAKEVVIPTCDKCSNEWINPETAEALDEALGDQERAELRALRSESVMDEYPAACRALDRLLHQDRQNGLGEMAQATQDAGWYPELSQGNTRRRKLAELTEIAEDAGAYDPKHERSDTDCWCSQHGDLECPVHPDCKCGCQAHAHWNSETSECIGGRIGCGCKRYRPREPGAVQTFNPAQRAREKQASRDADARALASGEKTVEQLRAENASFAFPRARIRFPKREK